MLIPVLASIEPRLLTITQAASYCGMTRRGYDRLRAAGKLPGYLPGTHRIDRRALDGAIDALSALGAFPASAGAASEAKDPLAEWTKVERDARKDREAAALRDGIEIATKPRRGGGVTTTYFHRATKQRLPNDPKSLAFKVAFARCEQDVVRARTHEARKQVDVDFRRPPATHAAKSDSTYRTDRPSFE